MDKQIISFTANEQALTRIGGECHYSSNKVSYIEAHFELGQNWDGFDSVRAVWYTDFVKGISTVLDSDGVCIVPSEVLKRKAKVKVNLVGSISVDSVLTDRLTSYPIAAVVVDADAVVESTETAEITPSQFEQFVAIVHDEVETITGMTAKATTLPSGSDATASYSDGVLTLGIPRGEQGEAGQDGRDGRDGVDGQDGADGRDGQDGADGADGFSPVVTVTEITGGHEVSIEDAVQTQTFDVMDGTTPVIPWDSILPQDSASGAIASFPDGTDLLPAKSLSVALEPVQSLNGYDKPWSGGNGANKWDEEWVYSGGAVRSANRIPLQPNTTYFFVAPTGSEWANVYCKDADGNTTVLGNPGYPFTTTSDTVYGTIATGGAYGTTYKNDIAINYPSSVTTYSPYENLCPISGRTECVTYVSPTTSETDAEVYTTTLGRTVYGGTLDVVSGELVVDRAMVTFDGTEDWNAYGSGSASAFAMRIEMSNLASTSEAVVASNYLKPVSSNATWGNYDAFASCTLNQPWIVAGIKTITTVNDWEAYLAQNPLQICYELATPQTYQLTETEVELLVGDNNVWSEGDVSVEYYADIQLWVEKKLSE